MGRWVHLVSVLFSQLQIPIGFLNPFGIIFIGRLFYVSYYQKSTQAGFFYLSHSMVKNDNSSAIVISRPVINFSRN